MDDRAEEGIEPDPRVRRIGRRAGQDQVDVEAGDRSGGGRQPTVVGPASPDGDQAIGALGQGGPDQELEVAQLVPAECQWQQVFALDPDLGPPAELDRQARQRGERRRPVEELEAEIRARPDMPAA